MSYKSPIEVITEEVILQTEDDIVKVVQNYGINVNKIELQKALMYDRKQYTQGFEDGRESIEEDYRSMEQTVDKLIKALAEAEPIRHGHWEYVDTPVFGNPYGSYKCDCCGNSMAHKTNYCPNCGAKMNGGME